jgi:hypothetical protein
MLRRDVILGLLAAAGTPAQTKLTVAQLVSFVKSSIELHHPDRQVAEYLKKVTLTNRLDARTAEDLQDWAPGPALRALNALGGFQSLPPAQRLPKAVDSVPARRKRKRSSRQRANTP